MARRGSCCIPRLGSQEREGDSALRKTLKAGEEKNAVGCKNLISVFYAFTELGTDRRGKGFSEKGPASTKWQSGDHASSKRRAVLCAKKGGAKKE